MTQVGVLGVNPDRGAMNKAKHTRSTEYYSKYKNEQKILELTTKTERGSRPEIHSHTKESPKKNNIIAQDLNSYVTSKAERKTGRRL